MSNRHQEPNAISQVGGEFAYLMAEVDKGQTGMDAMQHHRVLPRLKFVQGLTEAGLRDAVGTGSVVAMPARERLITQNERFDFVPLGFFEEFIVWRDRRDTSGSAIEARSFDVKSDIAKRARDAKMREEEYPGGPTTKPYKKKYTEHLNFAGIVYSESSKLYMLPCVLSFSRGEFSTGRQFISKIYLRRIGGKQAPLWTTVWDVGVGERKNQQGSWFGADIKNAKVPYIAQDHVEQLRGEHELLLKQIANQTVTVDMTDDGDGDPAEAGGTGTAPNGSPF